MSKKEPRKVRYSPERVLSNWRALIQALPYMIQEEVEDALKEERSKSTSEQRGDVILRLSRRRSTLIAKKERADREREARSIKRKKAALG